jgi:hypothetical protein
VTGYYVRARRATGKWESVALTELNDQELAEFFRAQGPERCLMWARALAGWIRDNIVTEQHQNGRP